MFFQNFRAFKILDAFRVRRDGKGGVSEPREWAALAFRISGGSKFHSNGEVFSADTGSVIYIPSGVGFTRVGKDEELIILTIAKTNAITTIAMILSKFDFLVVFFCFAIMLSSPDGAR